MADTEIPTRRKYRKRFASWAGERYGRYVVLDDHPDADERIRCRCDCGAVRMVFAGNLRKGNSKSCGCLKQDQAGDSARTHGASGTSLYTTWMAMRSRCHRVTDPAYQDYGARGISVCEEWRSDFPAFAAYVQSLPGYGERGRSIDRIDTDGGYRPGNLRWATKTEQALNRRNAVYVEHNGAQCRLHEIAEEAGISYKLAHKRWAKGLSIEQIMAPAKLGRPRVRA